MRRILACLCLATCLVTSSTCGGGGGKPAALPPLTPDPLVQTGCAAGPLAAGQVRAKAIACAAELIPGRLASGRVGDLVMENAKIRLVFRAQGDGYYMYGLSGGGLIDAAPVGGEDLFKELQPLADLNVGAYDQVVITKAGEDGTAEIVARGHAQLFPLLAAAIHGQQIDGLIEQHWSLAADDDKLTMRTVLRSAPGGASIDGELHQVQDAILFGGRVQPMVPGVGPTAEGSTSGELLASVGTKASYALVYPPTHGQTTIFEMTGFRLVFGPNVTVGDDDGVTRWLIVGDGSMASVTTTAWTLRGDPVGTASGTALAGADVVALDDAGKVATIARADAAGAYSFALPPGAYTLHVEGAGRDPGAAMPVTIVAGATATTALPANPAGTITVHAHDPGGAPIPARVTLSRPGADDRIEFVDASGAAIIPAAPATYRVSVSRGMEYDAFTATSVIVPADGNADVDAPLTRVVDTGGWISLDTHLHSEMSMDSAIPLEDRLLAVAAEGVELPVSTDHDFITDYQPVVDDLGLAAWVHPIVGEEASSVIWGHLNGWPLIADTDHAGQGAVPWYDRAPGEVFTLLRGDDPMHRVVQVNHPRSSAGKGMFTSIRFDPMTLTAGLTGADLGMPGKDLNDFSFDALEVANTFSGQEFEDAFVDWLALVGAGHPACATGSSDSHGKTRFAGNSRTFVWVGAGADDPATVDVDAVDVAIKARHVVVGEGAFVVAGVKRTDGTVSLPGDVVTVTGGTAAVHIELQAAPWMPLKEIKVYQGRLAVGTIPLDPADTAVHRYSGDIMLPVGTKDTFFVVRVNPAGPGDPVLGTPDASFTNPLLVDVDGDGLFTP